MTGQKLCLFLSLFFLHLPSSSQGTPKGHHFLFVKSSYSLPFLFDYLRRTVALSSEFIHTYQTKCSYVIKYV